MKYKLTMLFWYYNTKRSVYTCNQSLRRIERMENNIYFEEITAGFFSKCGERHKLKDLRISNFWAGKMWRETYLGILK